MLHGTPGCGKTLIARTVAAEFDAEVHEVSAASVFGAYTGRHNIATSLMIDSSMTCVLQAVSLDHSSND